VGLQTEVRSGDNHSILLFTKVASDEHLFGEVYRSRYDFRLTYTLSQLLMYGTESETGSTAFELLLLPKRLAKPSRKNPYTRRND
jgi:hypothetical protein